MCRRDSNNDGEARDGIRMFCLGVKFFFKKNPNIYKINQLSFRNQLSIQHNNILQKIFFSNFHYRQEKKKKKTKKSKEKKERRSRGDCCLLVIPKPQEFSVPGPSQAPPKFTPARGQLL